MQKSIRSFLALYPSTPARESMSAFISCMKSRNPTIKWEDPSKIHITLKFLGDMRPEVLDAVAAELETSIPKNGPIEGLIDLPGAFPNFRRPRIVWLGFSAPPGPVMTLQKLAEEVCTRHGLPPEEKRFTPHFTIGRVKRRSDTRGLENAIEACSFHPAPVHFTAVRMMESTLTEQGAIHSERAYISLTPGE